MGLGKSLKKIAKHAIAPVFSAPAKAIQKATGMDWKQQLGVGATIGGALYGAKGLFGQGPPVQGPFMEDGRFYSGEMVRSSGGNSFGNMFSGFGSTMLGLAGNIYGANQLAKGQREANDATIASAREAMAFQERMSSTAHQREAADLQAAGFNPALTATGGAGSSTPSGSSASFQNEAPDYRGAISSALEAKKMAADTNESMTRSQVNQGQLYVMAAQQEAANANADNLKQLKRHTQANADMATMTTDYARKHPGVFKSGQWIKNISPFFSNAAQIMSAGAQFQ